MSPLRGSRLLAIWVYTDAVPTGLKNMSVSLKLTPMVRFVNAPIRGVLLIAKSTDYKRYSQARCVTGRVPIRDNYYGFCRVANFLSV